MNRNGQKDQYSDHKKFIKSASSQLANTLFLGYMKILKEDLYKILK